MRIGLLTTSFPRHDGDIAGDFVLGFARSLAARGHELLVLAPEPAEPLQPPRWPGVRLRWVPYLRPRALQRTFYGAGVPDNLRRDARAWLGLAPSSLALALAARRELAGCDALVSHWALPCALAASSVRGDRPHLAVVHSADLHLLSRLPTAARLPERVARGASRLLFVCDAHRARFAALLPARARALALETAHVQPMGIDARARCDLDRETARRELGLSGPTLLTVARLVPVKGLVPAVRRLRHRGDLTWLIAGDGPEAAALARVAERAALRVRLLGTVTGARKHALLRAADAFVLPSLRLPSGRSEGVPTALLEAMAHGLPVIACDSGGIAQVARHGQTALLCDPDAPSALEHAVDRLFGDAELARALRAAARAEAMRHDWSVIAPRIEELLRPADWAAQPPANLRYPSSKAPAQARPR